MEQTPIILSILVITHNQRDLLKRCLNSVLGQKLNVPFEVIVSDDRSVDGTAEFIAELQSQIKSGARVVPNLQEIVYTRCNSNECDPKNVSERCGWNKLNVYNHARGKYFVNIDADDFLRNDDIYQTLLDMLEAHPECSMCMQDVWQVNDGEPTVQGIRWPSCGKLKNGQVISQNDIIGKYRALNQAYMIRRHPEVDCASLYGKYFDDTVITIHNLQFGPCVYLDRADYVWVQYKNSITKTLQGDDQLIEYSLLFLHHIRFIPKFAPLFMQNGISDLIHMLKVLSTKHYKWNLSDRSQLAFRETPGFIYRVFSTNHPSWCQKLKLRYIRLVALMNNHYNIQKWKYLYGLLTSPEMALKIDWQTKKTKKRIPRQNLLHLNDKSLL